MPDKVILLVEDNPDDEALTLRALQAQPPAQPDRRSRATAWRRSTSSSRAARHAARAAEPLPTLVILDLKLPKLDGLGVLQGASAPTTRTRLLPVVILTSSQEEQDLISGYELGANSYVRKPVDFNEFLEAAQGARHLLADDQPAPAGKAA